MKHAERIAKTKEIIQKSFMSLMAEKGYDRVTVTDIITRSEISRGTFYLHYLDKDDLLQKIEGELLDYIGEHSDLNDHTVLDISPYEAITHTFDWLYENREILRILVSEKGDPYFISKISNLLMYRLRAMTRSPYRANKSAIPREYALDLYVTGYVRMIFDWLSQPLPEEPATFTKYFLASENLTPAELFAMLK
ncbi:TetR/AcrR family transcriptional regulator [Weissella soli]|uniref:TetR/AcrR family transcriptional regulator n=1 Tax=Weissella soli TaxID=155866 RepID=UPI001F31CBC4|nr:TetR/AcrR family transcriptional regulator [Weissella soli]GJM47490.1 TetR family transcriptional regulator [Weissella soli]